MLKGEVMKKFTRLSLLLALSIVLNIVESLIPFFSGYIPGLKIGLANIVTLFILYKYSFKDAFYVAFLRVILVGIIRTGIFSPAFLFSLIGGILSIIMMYVGKTYMKLSIIGVSIIGSIFHSIGQILMAMFLLNTDKIIFYLPFILLFSLPAGFFTGKISKELLDNL